MEPVALIMDPDFDYGSRMIDYYWRHHSMRSVLAFPSRSDRLQAAMAMPAYHSKAIAGRVPIIYPLEEFANSLATRFDVRAVTAQVELYTVVAAELMQLFGLPWNSPELIATFRDKFRVKELVRRQTPGVRINASQLVTSTSDVLTADPETYSRFVLKPTDGLGNRDILIRSWPPDVDELDRYFAGATSPCTLEEFIDGPEFYVNGQIDGDGEPVVVAIGGYLRGAVGSRTNMSLGEFTVLTSDAEFEPLADYATRILRGSGLVRTPFHMEVIIDETGPCMVECGTRFVGHTITIDESSQHGPACDLVASAAHYWLTGSHCDLSLDWQHYDRVRSYRVVGNSTSSGVLVGTSGVRQLEAMPGFGRWYRRPRVGRQVYPTVDTNTIAWGVYLTGTDQADVDAARDFARSRVSLRLAERNSAAALRAKASAVDYFARKAAASVRAGRRLYR